MLASFLINHPSPQHDYILLRRMVVEIIPLLLGGLVDLLLGLASDLLSLVTGLSTDLSGVVLDLLALDLSVLSSETDGLLDLGGGVLCEEQSAM
jgi:hypothetical protein